MQAATKITDLRELMLLAMGSAEGTSAPGAGTGRDADADLDAVVRRAAKGDPGAFEQIFDRHVDEVHRRLTRLVGPVPEREDLVQEVFLAVHRGLPHFRGEASFKTWLHRILANIACSHLRRRQRTPVTFQVDDLPLAEEGDTPEEVARQRQQIRLVLELLERVKPDKRVAFILREVEGLSLVEIGRLVDAQPAAVGQRVKHARHELEQLMERHLASARSGRTR